jgi:hypothetical protein
MVIVVVPGAVVVVPVVVVAGAVVVAPVVVVPGAVVVVLDGVVAAGCAAVGAPVALLDVGELVEELVAVLVARAAVLIVWAVRESVE